MKVLLVTQYFDPENLPINFVAELMTKSNIEVDVITAKPNYPEGKFYKGFGFFSKITYLNNKNSSNIYRLPILPRGSGSMRGIKLGLNYLSFVISASIIPFFIIRKKKYDLVFVYANSPILKTIPALIIGRWKKIPVILWVQDLWPESFEASGFKLPFFARKTIFKIVKMIYNYTTLIACQSNGFRQKIYEDFKIPKEKLIYLPNTVDSIFENPPKGLNSKIGNRLKPYKEFFNIIFTGNIGEAQSIITILQAAEMLQSSCPNIRFLFVGGGSKKEEMVKYANENNLNNIIFLGSFPVSDMPEILDAASALIITLKQDPIFSLTIPNKLQSYLAAGKPILGSIEGEGAVIINDASCGFTCSPENPLELASICKKMFELNNKQRNLFGLNASKFYQENFSPNTFIKNFSFIAKESIKTF